MILVLISANSEWRAIRQALPSPENHASPYGEWFETQIAGQTAVYFQGGCGKISAAASTEHAIAHFHPDWVVNLGTCGGFAGRARVGEILLVEETLVYDIIEQMGDPAAAIAHYTTRLDLSWLPSVLPATVRRARLLSADRDIVQAEIPELIQRYDGIAADWESGAIAWVTARHGLPCLILRGVTDLVSPQAAEAYGKPEIFHERTRGIMPRLLEIMPEFFAEVKARG